MKGFKKNGFVLLMLITSIAWNSCSDDDNPMTAPTTVAGTWDLVSLTLTDAENNTTTTRPGDTIDFGSVQATLTNGKLEATDTDFSIFITVDIGAPITVSAVGTYTLNGATFTVTIATSTIPNLDVGITTFTVSIKGNELTFDNVDTQLIFTRS